MRFVLNHANLSIFIVIIALEIIRLFNLKSKITLKNLKLKLQFYKFKTYLCMFVIDILTSSIHGIVINTQYNLKHLMFDIKSCCKHFDYKFALCHLI